MSRRLAGSLLGAAALAALGVAVALSGDASALDGVTEATRAEMLTVTRAVRTSGTTLAAATLDADAAQAAVTAADDTLAATRDSAARDTALEVLTVARRSLVSARVVRDEALRADSIATAQRREAEARFDAEAR